MHNRPRPPRRRYQPSYEPHRLDPAFPFLAIPWLHPDHPITRLHQHDVLEIGWCHEGAGVFVIADKMLRFQAPCACIISERELHFAQSSLGTTSRWTFLFADVPRLLAGTPCDPALLSTAALSGAAFANVIAAAEQPALCRLVGELADESARRASVPLRSWQAAVRGLLLAILAHCQRLPGRSAIPGQPPAMDCLAPALACIGERHRESLPVPALARACGMTVSTFRRVFRATLGQSPKAYLTRFRVHQAAAALDASATSVVDAARSAGFASVSACNRHFRAVLGCSPRQWRQRTR